MVQKMRGEDYMAGTVMILKIIAVKSAFILSKEHGEVVLAEYDGG